VLACACLGVILAGILAVRVNAQNQSTEILAQRLREKDVPVKDVTLLSRVPYEIAVTLQSASKGNEFMPEDLWHAALARREVALAHRIGIQVDSYTLTLVNAEGEMIYEGIRYLHGGELTQALPTPAPSQLDDVATEDAVRDGLDLYGMSLDSLNVSSDTLRGMGQSLVLRLSVLDVNAANGAIPPFLAPGHIRDEFRRINSEYGTSVVICWIQIRDQLGNLLVNEVVDVETGEEMSSRVEDILPWYPAPVVHPTETPASSTEAPTPDVAPPPATTMPSGYPYP
jgi:hypothetical protein